VNGPAETSAHAEPTDMLGPGRLVLVVGPSGAGKDTLIRGVHTARSGDPALVFPRRVVTRPPSEAEHHDTMEAAAFQHAASSGAFALWWQAHGNSYGIPASIDDDVRLGRTIVCNVSRTVVGQARQRYRLVTVVAVTAPDKVLHTRLASRQRNGDGEIAQRIQRSAAVDRLFEADMIIRNVGRPEEGVRRLLRAIRVACRDGGGRVARRKAAAKP
jgi:ribose 1,5-bisphosphokinase